MIMRKTLSEIKITMPWLIYQAQPRITTVKMKKSASKQKTYAGVQKMSSSFPKHRKKKRWVTSECIYWLNVEILVDEK
jgi:hypothetical protein